MKGGARQIDGDARLSRRALLGRAGGLTLAAALAQLDLPRALERLGLIDEAYAAGPGLVEDTLNGLVAFVVPGPDAYSGAQGQRTRAPGGIAAGTTPALIRTLNTLQPRPPLASTVATLLNAFAGNVRRGAAKGRFRSPFANLSFREKAAVFRALEGLQGPETESLRFLAGNLPGLVAFLAYSEGGALDRRTRRLRRRPVGWSLSRYAGVADGRADFRGYFRGRRRAEPGA